MAAKSRQKTNVRQR